MVCVEACGYGEKCECNYIGMTIIGEPMQNIFIARIKPFKNRPTIKTNDTVNTQSEKYGYKAL